MSLDALNTVYVAEEATFAENPDADGSDFAWLMQDGPTKHKDLMAFAPTNYQNGENYPSDPVPTMDGWSLPLKFPAFGLSTAAGDNAAPPARGAQEFVLKNIFGSETDTNGEGVSTGSDANTLVLDASALGLQQLVPIYESGLVTPDRTQWGLVTDVAAAPSYELAPNITAPSTAAVAYGKRTYLFNTSLGSLAFYIIEDQEPYLLLGGGIFSAVLDIPSGGPAMWTCEARGDRLQRSPGGFGSLAGPTRVTQPAVMGMRSAFFFNGVAYEISSGKLDLKLTKIHRRAQQGANGRSAVRNIKCEPELTIDPLFSTTLEDAARIFSSGRVLYQIGGGVLANGRLNTVCIAMETAFISARETVNRDGEKGMSITLKATSPVFFGNTSTRARVFQYVQA